MYWKRKNKPARQNIADALETVDYSYIGQLAKKLGLTPKSRKKSDAIAEMILLFQDLEKLKQIWQKLNDLQQKAVAEAVYHKENEFDIGRFVTKYGAKPGFKTKQGYDSDATLLCLFICSDEDSQFIAKELADKMKIFIPKPSGVKIQSVKSLPESISVEFPKYQKQPATEVRMTFCETEMLAIQEVTAVTRLLNDKKILVSDKTFYPSASSISELVSVLPEGDFYDLTESKEHYPNIGTIKAIAWTSFFQAANFTQISAKKLSLSDVGRKLSTKPTHEVLLHLWEKWQKNTTFDEFRRIDQVKGQVKKGKNNLTGIKPRREAVTNALKKCQIGEWVSIEDFFKYVRVGGFDFEITRDEWELYVEESGYGSLGYDTGADIWLILQGRYILSLLFEYAATLGLIDVAYISPFNARIDYCKLWGVDDYSFLSRYDGLQFFRINKLGAFCLGLTKKYSPPKIEINTSLTVLPNLLIKVNGKPLATNEELFLENFAVKESDSVWHLSQELIIKSLESGQNVEDLKEFLQAREDQPLPDRIEGFLQNLAKRSNALIDKGLARLFECESAKIADEIAENLHTKKLCQRVGKTSLAVLEANEKKFRETVRKIGYGTKIK